mgnify:CR=1 FL=1
MRSQGAVRRRAEPAMGCAEEAARLVDSGIAQDGLGFINLAQRFGGAGEHENSMIQTVIGNAMAFILHAPHCFRPAPGILAQDKKCRGNRLTLESVEYRLRKRGPRAVIEGQGDPVTTAAAAMKNPAGEGEVGDKQGNQ